LPVAAVAFLAESGRGSWRVEAAASVCPLGMQACGGDRMGALAYNAPEHRRSWGMRQVATSWKVIDGTWRGRKRSSEKDRVVV
jgi:hypothetical protein